MCETVGQRTRGVQFERRRSIGRHVYGAELRQTLGSEEQNKELEDELERIRFCGDLWERGRMTVEMYEGSLLYLPRGVLHEARAPCT